MADRKLFIGNLVRRITQEDLWVMYSTFGPLEECAKFHESFGFVRFLNAEDARRALKATQGITLKGRCIKVEFAATTTSWRSPINSSFNESRSAARYNVAPIRAADLTVQREHHRRLVSTSSSSVSPPPVGPIRCPRKSYSKLNNSELNSSTTNSTDTRQSHKSFSSPPSSYAASSSHVTEIDDYDCDLDSGYNDEHSSPLLSSSSSVHIIPTSPWYDMPIADELFIWDFQLYADIARELPLIKTDNSSFDSADDDTSMTIDYSTKFNIEEYL